MAAAAVRVAAAAAVSTSASSRLLVSGRRGQCSGDGCVQRHRGGGGCHTMKAVVPPRGVMAGRMVDISRLGRVAAVSGFCSCRRRGFSSALSLQRLYRLQGERSCRRGRISCAMDAAASVGGQAGGGEMDEENWPTGPPPVFNRMHVRDPYKRLGISPDASNEEIQEARNYLVQQYKRHEKSVESIEAAFDKIIMEKFKQRKKSKINLKANLKKKVEEQQNLLRQFTEMWEVPTVDFILKRLFVFVMLGAWTAAAAAETGPVFQVVLTLAVCVYLLNEKVKKLGRSFLLGVGSLLVGCVFGAAVVPLVPRGLFPRSWSVEVLTALTSYVFMFITCTFGK